MEARWHLPSQIPPLGRFAPSVGMTGLGSLYALRRDDGLLGHRIQACPICR